MNGACGSSYVTAQFYAVRGNEKSQQGQTGIHQTRVGCEEPGGQTVIGKW
jgi:hypothetical protein